MGKAINYYIFWENVYFYFFRLSCLYKNLLAINHKNLQGHFNELVNPFSIFGFLITTHLPTNHTNQILPNKEPHTTFLAQ